MNQLTCFNPRPPGGGRRRTGFTGQPGAAVSIHAPRVEGDYPISAALSSPSCFNPRPPGGGRPSPGCGTSPARRFQSTPPGWRATWHSEWSWRFCGFQSTPPGWRATGDGREGQRAGHVSIHAPRVEGDPHAYSVNQRKHVSIHAPRVEGDAGCHCPTIRHSGFNPRPPGGGRQAQAGIRAKDFQVSIHAPRVEGDNKRATS